jgi:hypothetical protein
MVLARARGELQERVAKVIRVAAGGGAVEQAVAGDDVQVSARIDRGPAIQIPDSPLLGETLSTACWVKALPL